MTTDLTWTDDSGVTHGMRHYGTRCEVYITVKVYDARPVNCLACLGWVEPEYRPTREHIPMQQIPREKKR